MLGLRSRHVKQAFGIAAIFVFLPGGSARAEKRLVKNGTTTLVKFVTRRYDATGNGRFRLVYSDCNDDEVDTSGGELLDTTLKCTGDSHSYVPDDDTLSEPD